MMTRTRLAKFPFTASVLLVGCITGCARDNSADLRLTSLATKASFSQHFPDAYVARTDGGNTEVVLTKDDAGADVRQVMHVKVLWRPQRGTKQSHPSYTNAALHWYVFNDGGARTASASSAGTADVLEYTGAGFVRLAEVPGGTQVTIRNATLKPAEDSATSLNDPVGPSRLTGTFLAKKSPKRVNALLAEVKDATENGGRQEQASAE